MAPRRPPAAPLLLRGAMPAPLRATILALLALLLLAACKPSNPLLGRWSAEGPTPGFTVGSCEFRTNHMVAFGIDQDVDYQVSGKTVRVMPRQFGPHFEVTMLDDDTARVSTPFTGDILTLH